MKASAVITLFALLFVATACTTIDKLSPATSGEATNGDYELMPSQRTSFTSQHPVFLGLNIGGLNQDALKIKCYDEMLRQNNADGVFLPTYIFTKTRFPFFVIEKVELQGRPYKLKQK